MLTRRLMMAGGGIDWYLAGEIALADVVAAYQPIGAASVADSYVELSGNGTDAFAGVNGHSWSAATGWGFNGVNQYVGTLLAPGAVSWSMLVRFSGGAGTTTEVVCGCFTNAPVAFWNITPRVVGGFHTYAVGENFLAKSGYVDSGVMGFASANTYLNGVSDGTVTSIGTRVPVGPQIIIGGRNENGIPTAFFGGSVQAFALYSVTLTPSQAAAVSAAMAEL